MKSGVPAGREGESNWLPAITVRTRSRHINPAAVAAIPAGVPAAATEAAVAAIPAGVPTAATVAAVATIAPVTTVGGAAAVSGVTAGTVRPGGSMHNDSPSHVRVIVQLTVKANPRIHTRHVEAKHGDVCQGI